MTLSRPGGFEGLSGSLDTFATWASSRMFKSYVRFYVPIWLSSFDKDNMISGLVMLD